MIDNKLSVSNRKLSFYCTCAALLFLSVAFILLFSRSTSPLYYYFGNDSSIYRLLGISFLDGKVPYVDFFDHKGPIIIFIEALGQLFTLSSYGILVLQIINLFFVLLFIYKIASLITNKLSVVSAIILFFLLAFRFTITEGNMTEEYSLLPAIVSLYIVFKLYFTDKKLSFAASVVLGLCFSFPFWIRANNAGIACACVAFLFVVYVTKKDWKSLRTLVFGFMASVIAFATLLFVYFAYRGALSEMLYATFTFNIKYATFPDPFEMRTIVKAGHKFMLVASTVILIVGTFFYSRKKNDKIIIWLCVSLIVFGVCSQMLGQTAIRYMVLVIPIIIVGMLLFIKSEVADDKLSKISSYTIPVLLIALIVSFFFKRDFYKEADREYSDAAQAVFNSIPEEERKSTYCYDVLPKFYLITNLRPIYKYFIFQDFHGQVEPQIITDINNMVKTEKPLWVVLEKKTLKRIHNTNLLTIVDEEYNLYSENDFFKLYSLNQTFPLKQ